jgi:hypothetical protein
MIRTPLDFTSGKKGVIRMTEARADAINAASITLFD